MSNAAAYFGAGPAKIPTEVLQELQKELVEYDSTQISAMEISHRSKDFKSIIDEAEALVRKLLSVPDNYKVLFLQGGGVGQFAAVPLNLLSTTGKADYIVTGSWSAKSAKECQKYGEVNLAIPASKSYTNIPPVESWNLSEDASYIYYCDNETVDGVEFQFVPESRYGAPIVCDMSSNICSRKVDVSKFGVIFASAQKNIGIAGVTLVLIREDLLGKTLKQCPSVLDYAAMSKAESLYNTPPTFAIHTLRRCLQWIDRNGGIEKMESWAKYKSDKLYSLIDSSNGFYSSNVNENCRSKMNVVFRIGGNNEELEAKFLAEGAKLNLLGLKGHRSVGGIRASIYNAVSTSDVDRLAAFMAEFMKQNC